MPKLLNKWILVHVIIATSSLSCMAEQPYPGTGKGIGVTFLRVSEVLHDVRGKKEPLPPKAVYQNLSRYDAIWYSQAITERSRPAWDYLRKHAPEKLTLLYKCSLTSRTTSEATIGYDYINTNHPEWFLLKDTKNPRKADPRNPDNRIRDNPDDKNSLHYNRFYLDVCNDEFQDWAVQQILKDVSGKSDNLNYAHRGLAFDNVIFRRIKDRLNKPYPNWKYADDIAGWKQGFLRYLRKLHKALNAHGYILLVNFSFNWDLEENESDLYDLMDTADGIMHEWAVGYGTRYWSGEKWLRYLRRHEAVVKKGLIDWWACYPKPSNSGKEQFRYVYCSFLLIKRPGYSLFYASSDKGTDSTRDIPWYEEYDIPIGKPISDRYLQNGCWFRDYTNAKIAVNATDVPRKVVVDSGQLWLDWMSKKTVRELRLPAKSGRIFLPTPYKANSQ